MLEFLFEVVLQIVIDIIGQLLVEGTVALGWESLKDATRPEEEATPVLSAIGQFLMGLCAGGITLFIFAQRLTPRSPIPGLSLILSPIATGMVMHWIGERWRERGRPRPALFSFRGGASFAFGMALVRFLALERAWRLF